jgi:hypothetical protein
VLDFREERVHPARKLRPAVAMVGLAALLAGGGLVAVAETPASAAPPLADALPSMTSTYSRFYGQIGTSESFSSPAVGDVTGDGVPEIVTGGMDGYLRVFSTATGTPVTAPYRAGNGAVQSSPGLADVDDDGVADVAYGVTARGFGVSGDAGIVSFRDGVARPLFHRTDIPEAGKAGGFFGTPVVTDLNGDGRLDLVATSWSQWVYAWTISTGAPLPGFRMFVYDTIWSSPVVADLEGDGSKELIFGGDMDAYPGAPYPRGGMLWVVKANGRPKTGFPKHVSDQVIWSTPAVVDLDGDGMLDIVVGTGLNFGATHGGNRVLAFDHTGRALAGWPRATFGQVMASPAVGDLDGDGRPEVAVLSEGGRVHVFAADGSPRWERCADNLQNCGGGNPGYPTHGGVSMGDVDGDGQQEVVTTAEWVTRVYGPTGTLEHERALGVVFAAASPPTIANVGAKTWIVQQVTADANGNGGRGAGDTQVVRALTTNAATSGHAWPTFKLNMERHGTIPDLEPPTAAIADPGPQTRTRVNLSWSGSDAGRGIATFDVDVQDGAFGWVRWKDGVAPTARAGPEASGGAPFTGAPGHTYTIRVRSRDRAGNRSPWAQIVVPFSPTATLDQPFRGAYASGWDGSLSAISSPPVKGPSWPGWNVVRGLALSGDGTGGQILDAFGGLHRFGSASPLAPGGSWHGWDIARGLALNPDGSSGYVLDGFGGLHPVGGAKRVTNGPYWRGWDVARGVVLLPTSTKSAPAGYILDAYGAVTRFGAAPKVHVSAYWRGWTIARGFALDPTAPPSSPGGYVLDGFGGIHRFGSAPKRAPGGYWRGWDIARAVAVVGPGRGYTLDGLGGVHAFGGAPPVITSRGWFGDVAKHLAIRV